MGQSKALCEWIVETYGHRDDVADALRRGAVRQRARLVGLGDPDLPASDRARWAGDGDPPGDDALLHDDPRGGAARRPGGRDRRPRPGLRARHGRARPHRRPGGPDDPALRARSPSATSRSSSIGARPGEKLHEELWIEERDASPRASIPQSSSSPDRRSTPTGSRPSCASSSGWWRRATRSSSSAALPRSRATRSASISRWAPRLPRRPPLRRSDSFTRYAPGIRIRTS